MEDEIDLRKYIDVLLKHWKLIIIITGTAVIIAGLASFLSPSVYEAKASVLLTTARSDIVLEPNYRTELQGDLASMRRALLTLVKSPSVAKQVVEQLGDKVEPHERKISRLLDNVQASAQGDLIEISFKSTDSQKAADIANAWAKSYKSYVNGLYSNMLKSPEGLMAQVATADREYEEKQKALEDFIRDNRLAELNQEINDKEILHDVKLLREHIMSNSSSTASSTANNLTLVLLQTRAFTSLPEGLQISLSPFTSSDVSLNTIDALISTLEARSGGEKGQSLTELKHDILLLRADLEQERARQRELEGARNIAWEAYTTVARKIVELEVAAQAQVSVLEVAEIATVPGSPVASRRLINISIAFVLALVLGIFAAFAVEYFQNFRQVPAGKANKAKT